MSDSPPAHSSAALYFFRRILPFFAVFFIFEIIETSLIAYIEADNLDWSPFVMLKTLSVFICEILSAFAYWMIPFALFLLILPKKWHLGKTDRIFTLIYFTIFVGSAFFEEVSEAFFWDEFSATFNFIAVDYLIYTKEVIGNIYQSYPIIPIIGGVAIITALIVWACRKKILFPSSFAIPSWGKRLITLAGVILFCVSSFFLVDIKDADSTNNRYNTEIAKEGMYSLFSAFFKNELDYKEYYITSKDEDATQFLKKELSAPGVEFLNDSPTSIKRHVPGESKAKPNVILVVMESMGMEFFSENRKDGQSLTANLEQLAKQGAFFPHTYATGTRSVRGLEAVSTSIPPLPGMAILRRENNDRLATIGSIFADKGHDCKWIYGGYGYFDNMNNYFEGNGFKVLDRTTMEDKDITHSTIWGVCDEDLFKRAIREADASFSSGKPFLQFVFTTSNHRPYTYPDGKIDIPSKTGRMGAVKYSDFAVGEFIKQAKTKPWFDNTLFVFVADHGAGSAGKRELNPETHLIPLIFYAPKLISPERHEQEISQIDTLPTLLGLLKWDYDASFYGKDARNPTYSSRWFISNYQNIGYGKDNQLIILKPNKIVSYYRGGKPIKQDTKISDAQNEAVSYYQHASDWRQHLKQKDQKN